VLSNYGKLGTAFSPLALFAAGEQGAWYDPSDFSTMYQDSAGTTPVTAVGQSVGKILDKSGRNNHASQATAASRPVLQQDGNGKYYLAFDGVDDTMTTAAIDFTATDKMSVFAGVNKQTNTGANMLVELGPGGGAGSFYVAAPDSGANYSFAVAGSVANAQAGFTATTFTAPITNVISCNYDTAEADRAGEVKPRVNGVVPTLTGLGGASCGSGPFGASFALYVGRRGGLSLPFNGRIYSLIVRGKTGVTL
jgi:hypothetical protein